MHVQRELKIKAAYIAAIEDADPSVFDTPGFISGYVRSYARYLSFDPDWAFQKFCEESGFQPVHGMSDAALPSRMSEEDRRALLIYKKQDSLDLRVTPYLPPAESFWARMDFKAVLSSTVLACMIGLLGYGVYTVVNKVQQVNLVPVEQPPMVESDINPVAPRNGELASIAAGDGAANRQALDDMYQPVAETTPVLVPRDGPIASLDPSNQGVFARRTDPISEPVIFDQIAMAASTDMGRKEIVIFALDGVWTRILGPDGTNIFEGTLDAGGRFVLPDLQGITIERAGNSGALYVEVGAEIYGPLGTAGRVIKDVSLAEADIIENYSTPESLSPALELYLASRQVTDTLESEAPSQ